MTQHEEDRRRLQRYPAADLQVRWRPVGQRGGWQYAQARDFTRYGMALAPENAGLSTGDRVELRITLIMRTRVLKIRRVNARVVNQQWDGEQVLYGLNFELSGRRPGGYEQLMTDLGRIEGILDRIEQQWLRTRPLSSIPDLAKQVR